jgi:hypothetical protein
MASILKVDALQGITAAGDITVTSEGGAATQSLQQGLVKHFVAYQSDGGTAVLNNQSLNNASLTDLQAGDTQFNFTNVMSQVRYATPDSGGDNNGGFSTYTADTDMTAAKYAYKTGNASYSRQDTDYHSVSVLGDLA